MKKPIVKKGIWLRILLSPIIYAITLVILVAGLIFPISALIIMSLVLLIVHPFRWLFYYSGIEDFKPDRDDPFITFSRSIFFNHLLGITIHFWLPPYLAIRYILYSKFEMK